MDFAPGTGGYYSNTGYFLLSMIVERVEGQPLGRVLEARIFGPLGMTQTRLADPEAIIHHRAAGYWVNKTGDLINRNPTETSSTLGAGGILSSAYDLAKWDEALYGEQLLSAESKAAMWTPTDLPNGETVEYGFGWSLRPYQGLRQLSHGGQVAGFVANFSRFPEQEAAVIVFLNRYRVSSNRVKVAVLHTFMPNLGPIPE
jgi:CubicO group peptidase (beta-lactamase class C family)